MPSFSFPPTIAQLERIEQEKLLEKSSEQDLINAHLLTKVAKLEAILNELYPKGDSGDILPARSG